MHDVWDSARSYETYIGRWSRAVARRFIPDLGLAAGGTWLDVGSGSGALTTEILGLAHPERVIALDRSFDFVAQSRRAINDRRTTFVAADAMNVPLGDGCADAAVSGLVLNFVPRPELAVREMLRCVRPGGLVAAYLWDYAEGMQAIRMFWDAAVAVDRNAEALDEAIRFPICRPDALEQLFTDAGAAGVSVTSITVPTVFKNFEDLWLPFLGGQGPAPSYTIALGEQRRIALRERLRKSIPMVGTAQIALTAKAWVVSGKRG